MVGERLVKADDQGPATVLVPAESVLLAAVDLPLATRAKRLEALPFAIEDRIADPIEAVHLALGAELEPKRYLAGVVRHSIMADWLARIEAAGLGDVALVPDALALPRPEAGGWAVAVEDGRALVRVPDGTGFALPVALLASAWERAGRSAILSYGDPLPEAMVGVGASVASLAEQLARPALDLRQGVYAARAGSGGFWRRLGWIAAIAAVAHVLIAVADVVALRAIAYRKANETVALVQKLAPDARIQGDIAAGVADLLPAPTGDQRFAGQLARISSALMPMQQVLNVRAIRYEGDELVMDIDTTDPTIADQVRAAITSAGVQARFERSPQGGLIVRTGGA